MTMADVKLTPRQLAELLSKLDHGLRSVAAAKDQVLQAMAERRTRRPKSPPSRRRPSSSGNGEV
jgi:hypothetical protein